MSKTFEEAVEDNIDLIQSALDKAQTKKDRMGFTEPHLPVTIINGEEMPFDGELPANVMDLNSVEIVELMTRCNNYANWAEWKATQAKNELKNAEETLTYIKKELRIRATGTAQAKDDKAGVNELFLEANVQVLEKKDLFEIATTAATCARRSKDTLSRIIEVKKMQFDGGRREFNVQRKKVPTKRKKLR